MTIDRAGLERLLRPRSIAVVGISKEPGSLGESQLDNLERFNFSGEIYLVSRNRESIRTHACLKSVDELPHGVDAAILCVPRAGVIETLETLGARGVGAAMVFASGFAEQDEAGRRDQERIAAIAAQYGMAINGPNCLGLTNFVDGIPYAFGRSEPAVLPGDRLAAAVITQSGATMVNVARGLGSRGVPVTYQISTGNEAVLGIEDYLAYVLDDERHGPIALFAEQIRHPQRFLALARLARERGRRLVLLHPGRSEAARDAARSHTGALAGDYGVMSTVVASEGVLVVDDLDMLVDAVTIVARYPVLPVAGLAITSDSGAVKSLALDQCADLGLDLPSFSAPTLDAIHQALPSFAVASNPLDLTAQCIYDGLLYERTAHALLADPGIGSFLAIIQHGPNLRWLRENRLFAEMLATDKPALVALPLADARWPDDLVEQMSGLGVAFTNTSSQALRALAALTQLGRRLARLDAGDTAPVLVPAMPLPAVPALPEYAGKALLRAAGIATPAGDLAHTVAEAAAIASRIGYPVALKAASAALTHQTEAGAVILNLADAAALALAWEAIESGVRRARPDVVLEGCLVEAMAPRGLELAIGAKRDPDWGTVLLAGLGGIWIEVLGDVRLFAAGAGRAEIRAGLQQLRASALLAGARGSPPADLEAVVDALHAIAALMAAYPAIVEIDVNPLVVYAAPNGAMALDALVAIDAAAVR